MYALVDDADCAYLEQFNWICKKNRRTFYAYRTKFIKGKQYQFWMHREILGLKKGEIGDHIDHNGLNNQCENLRKCTHSQNLRNASKRRGNTTSKYKGVTRCRDKWRAVIRIDQRKHSLGNFDTQEEAARAYNEAAKKYFGCFAYVNIV